MSIDDKRVGKAHDKRVKLTDAQKKEIQEVRKTEGTSFQKIADMYGVSKRTIEFVIYPERLEENKRKTKERGISYYDKDKHNKAVKGYRKHKADLVQKELI